ncbi:Ataxin-10 [Coemansia sp. RSA 2610]|nr:Ataxin-10 [Coemansia sp. RSA 2610]
MDSQRLQSVQQECAALKDSSPHPSRPHLSTAVEQSIWTHAHALFGELLSDATNNDDLDIDPQAGPRSDALSDLCVFVRNAAAMDRANQTAADEAGIVNDVIQTIQTMLRCEATYPEASQCGAVAGQALSNLATSNSRLQQRLVERELRDCLEPIESVFWYLLASTNPKTNLAGQMVVLNTIKHNRALTETLCASEAGQMLVSKVGKMFSKREDDKDDAKTIMYAVVAETIEHNCLGTLLTDDPELDSYGLLDVLAVYCSENRSSTTYSQICDPGLLSALSSIIAKCHDLLCQVWQASGDSVEMSAIVEAYLCLTSALSVLIQITEDADPQLAARVLDSQVVHHVIRLLGLLSQHLPRIEKASKRVNDNANVNANTNKQGSISHLFMFKRHLIQIIGNIAYYNKPAQDLVRELDGLALVLDHMRIDDNHPYIKEYAVVALKSLLLNNPENQEYVQKMETQSVADDPEMARVGVQPSLSASGRVSLKKMDSDKPDSPE